jgi:hypothetical protein
MWGPGPAQRKNIKKKKKHLSRMPTFGRYDLGGPVQEQSAHISWPAHSSWHSATELGGIYTF